MLPVLGKVPALFEYQRDATGKPTGGTTDVLAYRPSDFTVTGKMHGTCCYVKNGAIYARQDIRHDISKAPAGWFPTAGEVPDKGGHIIGFRPLDAKKGDRWHLEAISRENKSVARFLEYDAEAKEFFYNWRPIAEFEGKTVELVGPKVNGNPHRLIEHAYNVHGSVVLEGVPWETKEGLRAWLDTEEGLQYEGIVIHDKGAGRHYKCHRGHLGGEMHWSGWPLRVRGA